METITILLGGRDFHVTQATHKRSKAWRAKFQELIGPLTTVLESLDEDFSSDALQKILPKAKTLFLDSPDLFLDLLLEYDPALARQKEWIEENAYDTEIFKAFMEVTKLAFPFIGGIQKLMDLGLHLSETSKSSPDPNGAVPSKTSTELR